MYSEPTPDWGHINARAWPLGYRSPVEFEAMLAYQAKAA